MILTVDGYCRIRYRGKLGADGNPTKAQLNTVADMCRKGILPAFKAGKVWLIDMEELKKGPRRRSAEAPNLEKAGQVYKERP